MASSKLIYGILGAVAVGGIAVAIPSSFFSLVATAAAILIGAAFIVKSTFL